MASENHNEKGPDNIDRVLRAVENMLEKKLKSDDIHQKAISSSNFKSAVGGYLAVAITLAVGAGGIVADAYLENRDRDDQIFRDASQRKLAIISGISNAITSMREVKDVALVYCGQPSSKNGGLKNKEERVRKEFELLHAARPVLHFFNKKFRLLIIELIAWEDSIKDYCDKNAPGETEWRRKQKEIEEQMVLAPVTNFIN